MYVVREVLKRRQESVKGWKVGIQGVSQLALTIGRSMQAEGAVVTAIADGHATIYDDKGLNLDEVAKRIKEKGSLKGAAQRPPAALFNASCELLVLTGDAHGVNTANVDNVRTRVLVEVSPSAVAYEVDERLVQRGVLLIPDILTQAGAVTAQYVEWVQDIQAFFWDDNEVNTKLETLLATCLGHVFATAVTVGDNLRLAAHCIAVKRVAEALKLRGIYP